ncbi:spore coat protein [Candidatus Woesearchaeota archaeon CG10_big_fil_rev_8_21_14_0_10_30_7]|nr:MAG: spore coat protein [Candidatus Woesearchaeota archaeon CG10_big_fil_rev_8_21_14_0_10_30_7]
MKGIILAGGMGTRLSPLTKVTNKHLLPVYDKPMIYYPLEKLVEAGLKDIMIITGPEYAGHFVNVLGNGEEFKVNLTYKYQKEAGGIAQALSLAEKFVDGESCAVILGDNIYEDSFKTAIQTFQTGMFSAYVFLKKVEDPKRFGVAEIVNGQLIGIEEKPAKPKSNLAVTGFYLYPPDVFDIVKTLKPSERKELEITDVNNHYVKGENMGYHLLKGFWTDAGTIDSLYRAAALVINSKK